MNLKYISFVLLFHLYYQFHQCNSESITFINVERPSVFWYDTKYVKNYTVISKRLNRQDPRHYVELYVHLLVPASNKFKLDFYFYQFLTNRYKPSFVEMHFKFCDMMQFDTFFGQAMRNALGGGDCPYPPGIYDLKNISAPYVPKGFPFTKGRIYCNVSYTEGGSTKPVGAGKIDMELKVAKIKTN